MKLEKIDHVVITVKDLNKTIDFYTNILGMKLEKFSSSLDKDQLKIGLSKEKLILCDNEFLESEDNLNYLKNFQCIKILATKKKNH